MNRAGVLVAVLVAVVMLSSASIAAGERNKQRTVVGTLLIDFGDGTCQGVNLDAARNADLVPTARVTLKDAKGKVVGATSLDTDGVQRVVQRDQATANGCTIASSSKKVADQPHVLCTAYKCAFTFSFKRVPTSSAFYAVQVGQRLPVTYYTSDLKQSGWRVYVSV